MPAELLVLLPGYNVGRHLAALIPAIRQDLPEAGICLVDDGSSDDTANEAQRLGLVLLPHETNRGKGAALKTGFRYACEHGFGAVITMDADGQHLPSELPRFVAAWQAGAPVVLGSRMAANENMPWLRKRTNEFASSVVSRLVGQRVEDSQSGYRLFDTKVLRAISLESSRYDLESEILIKAGRLGYRVVSVPITTVYHDEVSSINPFIDTLRFCRLVWRARRWTRHPGAAS
jgi:glycosyltransferase involved in cell wall biosynthesis